MKDIQPTTTQMKRILAGPLGSGVLLYYLRDYKIDGDVTQEYSEENPYEVCGAVEVVQITVNLETGEITKDDGSPLIFWTDARHAVGYQLVRLTGQGEMKL